MIRIGVICPSEIAYRRFMPALSKCKTMVFAGIGIPSKNERFSKPYPSVEVINQILKEERSKAFKFLSDYGGGKLYESYEEIVSSPDIDAVYIPLPPALHFKWAKKALLNGKHVLVEKPSTIRFKNSEELVSIARAKNLALHENYMFIFHKQIKEIDELIESGKLGDIRLIRISFGFPKRNLNDFRYNKKLGGGSLIDAGGYPIKYASYLLGPSAKIVNAQLNYTKEFEVDLFGSGVMNNDKGTNVQFAFGMDNDYKCDLEIWGSRASFKTNRILTAPNGYVPSGAINENGIITPITLSSDDSFYNSLQYFCSCISDEKIRKASYYSILKQAKLLDSFKKKSR